MRLYENTANGSWMKEAQEDTELFKRNGMGTQGAVDATPHKET
jgi:hypothetical protein